MLIINPYLVLMKLIVQVYLKLAFPFGSGNVSLRFNFNCSLGDATSIKDTSIALRALKCKQRFKSGVIQHLQE